jgi:hypothetical protein
MHLGPLAIADRIALPRPNRVQRDILRGAIEIGPAIGDRSGVDRLDPEPEILERVFRRRRIAQARGQKAQQFDADLRINLSESG